MWSLIKIAIPHIWLYGMYNNQIIKIQQFIFFCFLNFDLMRFDVTLFNKNQITAHLW